HEPAPKPVADQTTTIIRPIPFDSETRLEPYARVAGDFPIEERRRVTINVTVECEDCIDDSLTIYLLDEYNYRMLESDQPYDPIDSVYSKIYFYSGPMDRGHYFIVLENASDSQEVAIKVKANLSYIQDNLTAGSR
ncbi:MAG TPA: hypothetical protein VIM99_04650, partial [Blastocatellia bacterium]